MTAPHTDAAHAGTVQTGTVHVLSHPLAAEALAALRNRDTPSPAFRARMRALGALLLMDSIRDLPTEMQDLQTPMGPARVPVLRRPLPCLVSILRAGDGLLAGMQDLLPDAPVGQIGLWRDETTLRPVEYQVKLPRDLPSRLAIVADPMLATAGSAIAACTRLRQQGARNIRFLAALAAPEGLAAFAAAHPGIAVTVGAVDERLNEHGYILPGLGDAGDRLFGTDGAAP